MAETRCCPVATTFGGTAGGPRSSYSRWFTTRVTTVTTSFGIEITIVKIWPYEPDYN